MSKSLKLAKSFLGTFVEVIIDRPLGTKHPKFNYRYPINYGYVKNGPIAPDGEEVDVYVIGASEPLKNFTGMCVAVVHRKDDDDDKLVVVSEDKLDISDKEILSLVEFQEKYFDSVILRS